MQLVLATCWAFLAVVQARLGTDSHVASVGQDPAGPGDAFWHRKLQRAADAYRIPNEYVVVFEDSRVPSVNTKLQSLLVNLIGEVQVLFEYETALRGFSVRGLPLQVLVQLLGDPDIAFIEENQIFEMYETAENPTSWGLDRLDQTDLPLDSSYTSEYTGAGVTAFIADSGIRITHSEFTGRASCGFNAYEGVEDCFDGIGHGTHVAGTVGGATYGVAKGVNLVAVKVLDAQGTGSTSDIIAGINYIKSQKDSNPDTPMVANLSLGGYYSAALNRAVDDAVAAGVFFAVAAGNSRAPACWFSPASAAKAVTVGASTDSDTPADFSNYGSCVGIFAPGESITSAWNTSDDASETISGTSMASPHVCGAGALYLEAHPDWSPSQVWEAMRKDGASNILQGQLPDSPNLLLNIENLNAYGSTDDPTDDATGDDEKPSPPPVSAIGPVNDYCLDAVVLYDLQDSVDGTTEGATIDNWPSCVDRDPLNSPGVWYRLEGNGGMITIDTCETDIDTYVFVFEGTCSGLVCVDRDDDGCTSSQGNTAGSIVSWQSVVGETYLILVSGYNSTQVGEFRLDIESESATDDATGDDEEPTSPPISATGPGNDECLDAEVLYDWQDSDFGTNVGAAIDNSLPSCVVQDANGPGVWYQLEGNGGMITIDTCNTTIDTIVYVFNGTCSELVCVVEDDDGCNSGRGSNVSWQSAEGEFYKILVSGYSSKEEGDFRMRIKAEGLPGNDECQYYDYIYDWQDNVNGTTAGATIDAPFLPSCVDRDPDGPGVWYRLEGNGGMITIDTCNTEIDTVVYVFSGTCVELVCVDENDDGCSSGYGSTVSWQSVEGESYKILVSGYSSKEKGEFRIDIETGDDATDDAAGNDEEPTPSPVSPTADPATDDKEPSPPPVSATGPVNDYCLDAVVLYNLQDSVDGTTAGATIDTFSNSCFSRDPGGPGVWYQLEGNGGMITIDTCETDIDTYVYLFQGTCSALACVAEDDDSCTSSQGSSTGSIVSWQSVEGESYLILVAGYSSSSEGEFRLHIDG